MLPPFASFPSAAWGAVRLVALRAILRHQTLSEDYQIQGIFELTEPTSFAREFRICHVMAKLPANGLPVYRIGSLWRGVTEVRDDEVIKVASGDLTSVVEGPIFITATISSGS